MKHQVTMENEIVFMPLGGGQSVGASCYFLKLGDANILLDAGSGTDRGLNYGPDLHKLCTSPYLDSLGQINQIFISHAHWDHVGYLPEAIRQTGAQVYMTEMTAVLAEYQLYDRCFMYNGKRAEEERLAVRQMLERIVKVNYLQTLDFGTYKVTFLPAGHIPGAMMMLFEYQGRKILYTGDYSTAATALTDGCMFPGNEDIDAVILCGLHAKRAGYEQSYDALYQGISRVLRIAGEGRSVMCQIPQLSKGVEFLKELDIFNHNHIPIYVDPSIMAIVEKMEQMAIPILNADIHVATGKRPERPHIYITSQNRCCGFDCYEQVRIDFSLHEGFEEIVDFLKQINPKEVYVVHCGDTRRGVKVEISGKKGEKEKINGYLRYPNARMATLESDLAQIPDNQTKVIYAEESREYVIGFVSEESDAGMKLTKKMEENV